MRNFGCGIFIDFQELVDTVYHDILIQKWTYYGVRGTGNNQFSSYLQNRTQFVSINGYSSYLHSIHCGLPQGFIFGISISFTKSFKALRLDLYRFYLVILPPGIRWALIKCHTKPLGMTKTLWQKRFQPRPLWV